MTNLETCYLKWMNLMPSKKTCLMQIVGFGCTAHPASRATVGRIRRSDAHPLPRGDVESPSCAIGPDKASIDPFAGGLPQPLSPSLPRVVLRTSRTPFPLALVVRLSLATGAYVLKGLGAAGRAK